MSELRPYERLSAPPIALTAGARFIRGFRRIGIVLGALVLIGSVCVGAFIGFDQQRTATNRYGQAVCLAEKLRTRQPLKMETYDASKIDTLMSGCPGPLYSATIDTVASYSQRSPAPIEHVIEPTYYGTLIGAAAGIFVFAACWLIGWLCAGFTRDQD
jgi:hypothetical protein